MMRNLLKGLIIPILFVFFSFIAFAQTVTLEKQAVGSGGVVSTINNNNIEMSGMVSQFAIGVLTESVVTEHISVNQGFWVPDETGTAVDEPTTYKDKGINNFPNPFSSTTTIRYNLENNSYITLKIYDIMGNVVTILFDGLQNAGQQDVIWDGKDAKGIDVGSGSYLYELNIRSSQMAGLNESKNLILRNVMIVSR
jgi:flagellar hook assembly protein FlgD